MSPEKDTHLTLRLPGGVIAALDARAASEGRGRSAVVREAVATYLAGGQRAPVKMMRASELARLWESAPHLTKDQADRYAQDIRAARDAYAPERDPWE